MRQLLNEAGDSKRSYLRLSYSSNWTMWLFRERHGQNRIAYNIIDRYYLMKQAQVDRLLEKYTKTVLVPLVTDDIILTLDLTVGSFQYNSVIMSMVSCDYLTPDRS